MYFAILDDNAIFLDSIKKQFQHIQKNRKLHILLYQRSF